MKTRVYNATAQATFLASLAVASLLHGPPAQAQYMVMEGDNAPSTTSQFVCCQTICVQDYSSFCGVNSAPGETENGLSSTEILNGMFDGYVGLFGAIIGIPAIAIAALRLFVNGQTDRKAKKNTFELPAAAAPAPTRFYRPSATANY